MTEFTEKDFREMNFNTNLEIEAEVENEADTTLLSGTVKGTDGEWRDLTDNEIDILSDDFSEFVWESARGY